MIKNKAAVIAAKFIIFLVAGLGVGLGTGMLSGFNQLYTLNYFTLLSGAVIAFYYLFDGIYLAKECAKGKELPVALCPTIKHMALFASLLTGAVANTLLTNMSGSAGVATTLSPMAISGDLLHKVTPILVLIDFVVFERHGSFSIKDPLISALFPLAYFAYIMIGVNFFGLDASPFSPRTCYPYPFLDPATNGVGSVVIVSIIIASAFIAVGYLLYALDKLLAKRFS